jgi:tetratricopeptide (TPR) repeat protein
MTTAWAVTCAGAVLLVLAPVIPRSPAHERWSAAQMIGAAWLSRGEAERALPYFQEAAAIDTRGELPQSGTPAAMALRAVVHMQLGVTLQTLGRYAEALSELQKAVELAPRTPDVAVCLGDVAAAVGQTQRAWRAYAAAGMSPSDAARRLVGLAQSEDRRGRPGVTVAQLHAACELDPGYEMAVIPYVRMQIEAGAYGEAVVWLEKARGAGLDENVYRAHAAWIAQKQGNSDVVARLLSGIPHEVLRSDPRVAGTLDLMAAKSSK